MDHVHTANCASEYRMLLVQPRRLLGRDEELRAVGVGTGVGHADRIWLVVLERGKLVGKFRPPDALAPSAVAKWIAALIGS